MTNQHSPQARASREEAVLQYDRETKWTPSPCRRAQAAAFENARHAAAAKRRNIKFGTERFHKARFRGASAEVQDVMRVVSGAK
jgi:hypothetical protein